MSKLRPFPLNAEDAGQTTVGRLDFQGGLALSSPDPRFGDFSALGVSADGWRMVALTDRGTRFSARLAYDERGQLTGLRNTNMGAMSGLDGAPLEGTFSTDAEAMCAGVEGEIIVAFERRHRSSHPARRRAAPGADRGVRVEPGSGRLGERPQRMVGAHLCHPCRFPPDRRGDARQRRRGRAQTRLLALGRR